MNTNTVLLALGSCASLLEFRRGRGMALPASRGDQLDKPVRITKEVA